MAITSIPRTSEVPHRLSLTYSHCTPVRAWFLVFLAIALSWSARAANPFAENVRSTAPLTPQEQLKTFRLPPGFEIQLVAQEKDIHKPMNLAFDTRGRLWVTTSREYPSPVPVDQAGRDRVMIFEDMGPDGRARKVTQFADGLNIPIGVYPFRSPSANGQVTWKAVVWSIPHLWLFEDVDGDGRADKKEKLYGPFDHTRDTHGNQSSFRRSFDGWMYATHGFNNHSKVRGRDGNLADMQSGNTYRVLLNGDRIEHHTWGQVNPFGMAWDPFGNLYSADCHSSPVYQLLAGGYYPSFGKPHDGLGFAPVLMQHTHGSTAIDAMFYYADNLWPDEFKDNAFVGNVMTSRMNRDQIVFHGSTPKAQELDDFVKCEDPWFRPVDARLGPDGAMYIADFYNRIIGHYEVPLNHPGRDRERGRIWRVIYAPKPGHPLPMRDGVAGLIEEMASPNLERRLLAMNEITDVYGSSAIPSLQEAFKSPLNPYQYLHLMWLLDRLDQLSDTMLEQAAAHDSPEVRVHAMRVVGERARRVQRLTAEDPRQHGWNRATLLLAQAGLKDSHALVQRCAAEALGLAPHAESLPSLLALRQQVPAEDSHLLYVVRKSLRNQLRDNAVFEQVQKSRLSEEDLLALADVAVAVQSEMAGDFLISHRSLLEQRRPGLFKRAMQHAARHAPPARLDALAQDMQARPKADLEFEMSLFQSIQQGLAQRGSALSPSIQTWGRQLAATALTGNGGTKWVNTPLENVSIRNNPWAFQERPQADGGQARLLSSIPRGESLTGVLRSPTITLPAQLSFYLSGHDGYPDKPAQGKNLVRLRSEEGKVLAQASPPRNDTAQKVVWDLSRHEGTRAFLEVVDGDTATAYAWLAVGRFEPPVLTLPSDGPTDHHGQQVVALQLMSSLGVPDQGLMGRSALYWWDLFRGLALDPGDEALRQVAVETVVSTAPPELASRWLGSLLENGQESYRLREAAGVGLAGRSPETVIMALKTAPRRLGNRWAEGLASSPASGQALVNAVAAGTITPRILQERVVRDRLLGGNNQPLRDQVTRLTADLPPANAELQKLLQERRAAFTSSGRDLAQGKLLFEQACAICHQLDGAGGLVGPQLDGIGNRGVERIIEDILDPNRNVDHAFRTTVFTLKDGDVVSGLFRREEGELYILANAAGLEVSIPKETVESRKDTDNSPMPDNFHELFSKDQFNDVLTFMMQ